MNPNVNNLPTKNFLEKIKRSFWKMIFLSAYFFGFKLKIYQNWSLLYRKIYQSKYKNELPKNLYPDHAQNIMNQVRWSKDGAKEFWDAIGSPHWFQHLYEQILEKGEQPTGAVDCDEFAFWAANTISGKFLPKVINCVWLESYRDKSGKLKHRISGHHVCSAYNDAYFHVGNWGKSRKYNYENLMIRDIFLMGTMEHSFVVSGIVAEWYPSCKLKKVKFFKF